MSAATAIDPEYVADLERRVAVAEATNSVLAEANARLERLLAQARHEKFGPRSEKGDPDQRNLFTEDLEVAEGQLAAASEGEPMERQWSDRHWRTDLPHFSGPLINRVCSAFECHHSAA